jgi:methyl-accepting chemotaxis protein
MAIKRGLRDIGEGKLDTRLRESDSKEFAEITEAFNLALAKVNEKVAEAKQDLEQIAEQPKPNQEDMEKIVKKCASTLDYFQTMKVKG